MRDEWMSSTYTSSIWWHWKRIHCTDSNLNEFNSIFKNASATENSNNKCRGPREKKRRKQIKQCALSIMRCIFSCQAFGWPHAHAHAHTLPLCVTCVFPNKLNILCRCDMLSGYIWISPIPFGVFPHTPHRIMCDVHCACDRCNHRVQDRSVSGQMDTDRELKPNKKCNK